MQCTAYIRKYFSRTVAMILILNLFVSGMGFSLFTHYCAGELKSWSVFAENKMCDMAKATEVKCPMHEKMVIRTVNNCCQDHEIKIDRVDQTAKLIGQQTIQNDLLIADYSGLSLSQEFPVINLQENHLLKRPPPDSQDTYILVQSFLL